MSNADWHSEGLYVRIKISTNDNDFIHPGMIGIIQSISVRIYNEHETDLLTSVFVERRLYGSFPRSRPSIGRFPRSHGTRHSQTER